VPKTSSMTCELQVLANGRRSADRRVRLIDRAAATALPRRVERVLSHTVADVAAPAGPSAAADQQATRLLGGSRFPGRAPPPAPETQAAAAAPDRLPGHGSKMAPGPHAPPPRRRLPSQTTRPSTDPPQRPGSRPATGPREQRVGLQKDPRRTRGPRYQGRTLQRVGDPEATRDRAGART
jgi:hypothetical protein